MAISFVQSASALGNGNVAVAFTNPNTAGNVIVMACAAIANGLPLTLNDSKNNSYNTVVPFNNQGNTCEAQIFFAFNIAGGANTVTFAPGAAVASMIAVHEFSGVDTIDQLSSNFGVGNAQDSLAASPTRSNELLFGFTAATAGTGLSITRGAGFTLAESHIDNSTAIVSFLTQWQIVSSLGNYNSPTSTTVGKGGSVNWGAEIETFYSSVSFVSAFVTRFGI